MPTCNGLDTGSKFARRESEQTSSMVLNHGKRSGGITVLVWMMISMYGIDGHTGYENSIPKGAYREVSKEVYFTGGCVTMPYQCLSRMR